MANICFIMTSMGSGGAERNVSILANEFVKRGNNVSLILLFNNKVFYKLDDTIKIFEATQAKGSLFSKLSYWKKQVSTIIKKENIDCVIGIGIKYGLISSYCLSKNKKVKLIVRGTSTYNLSFLEKMACFFFQNRINQFVVQTNTQKLFLTKKLRNRSVVISNPFDIQTSNYNVNGFESMRFISVGRLDFNVKKTNIILLAFSDFQRKHPNLHFKLDFYGRDNDGKTLSQMCALIEKHDIKNVFIYEPTLDIHKEIIPSTAFICASTNEGMPNALIESLLLGIPCISSNWAGSEEIVSNSVNGMIYGRYDDIVALSECMYKLASLCKDKFEFMSNNAYILNHEKYSKEAVIGHWLEIITKEGK